METTEDVHWMVRNGTRIATRREDKGLNQSELAYRCGVTQQTISRTERGESDPRWWLKDRLAAVLDTTADELFGNGVGNGVGVGVGGVS